MDPAIVIVIRNDGIREVRLVASNSSEEKKAINLYLKIQKPVNDIHKILERNGE